MDGKTSYARRVGKDYASPTMTVGEAGLFRTASKEAGKAVLRWEKGIYVGRSEKADDVLYLTERGLSRTNAFRRVTEEERWDK